MGLEGRVALGGDRLKELKIAHKAEGLSFQESQSRVSN